MFRHSLIFLMLCCMFLFKKLNAQTSYDKLYYEKVTKEFWEVKNDFKIKIPFTTQRYLEYKITAGYRTNFRSGPKFLDLIVEQLNENNNKLNIAWLIHDVNYEGYITRAEADTLLFVMLLDAGVRKPRAKAIYWGLRVLGESFYSDLKSSLLISFNITTQETPENKDMARPILQLGASELFNKQFKSTSNLEDLEMEREIENLFPEYADEIKKKALGK